MTRNEQLLVQLQRAGVLTNARSKHALAAIDRADFVPDELRESAYDDRALPIGGGQTISQPYTVALMLDLLNPEYGQTILDIGSGSGWQTALLAHIVSNPLPSDSRPPGKVIAVERIAELHEASRRALSRYSFIDDGVVELHTADATAGWPEAAPFDRIIAAAALGERPAGRSILDTIPVAWREQLKVGGRIVAPVGNSVLKLTRTTATQWEQEEHPGFAFVPFVSQ